MPVTGVVTGPVTLVPTNMNFAILYSAKNTRQNSVNADTVAVTTLSGVLALPLYFEKIEPYCGNILYVYVYIWQGYWITMRCTSKQTV